MLAHQRKKRPWLNSVLAHQRTTTEAKATQKRQFVDDHDKDADSKRSVFELGLWALSSVGVAQVLLVNAGSIPGAAQQVRLFSRVASIGGGRRRAP